MFYFSFANKIKNKKQKKTKEIDKIDEWMFI